MERVDCAVVGGGVSGLYAAWRLGSNEARASESVAVFEADDRLGGRIDTVPVGHSTARVELGAMRFWKTQRLVTNLLEHLTLPIEEFPCQAEVCSYLRGVLIRPANFAQPANVPFRLRGAEVGQDVGGLIGQALLRIAPELAGPVTPAQLDALAERPDLGRIGFWNALEGVLSSEAYQLVQAGMGDRASFSNWHAGEAMRFMAFVMNSINGGPLYRPVQGFSSLVDALAATVRGSGESSITTGRRLLTIERARGADAGSLLLTFEASDVGATGRKAEHYTCVARKVILALPKRALSDVLLRCQVSLGLSRELEHLLGAVDVFSAFKLFASYAKPWWTQDWGVGGYSVTDLPIQQVYYGAGVGGTDADNQRVLLASYADSELAAFWGPLIHQPAATSGPPPAESPVVAQVMDQVRTLHGLRKLPEPEWWTCRDWGAHGGAWHAWRPGQSVPDTIRRVRHPVPDLPIFVCGEAFSRMQGWIEGALTSTERTLQSPPFNLARPAFLPPDYDLGP